MGSGVLTPAAAWGQDKPAEAGGEKAAAADGAAEKPAAGEPAAGEPAAGEPAADEDAAAEGPKPDAAGAGKDAAGAAAGAGGGAGAAKGTSQPPTAPPEQSYLEIMWQALGWSYSLIFLGISFTFVALLVMCLLTARRENVCPTVLIDEFEKRLDSKQYQDAYELAKGDDSFLGLVLSAGLAKLTSGYSQAIEAMQEVGEEENMKLDHRLSYMGLIGTISPMVGLFGTVQGMISSFRVIATSVSTPPPSKLAEGIATALFTTLVGLAIAIPALAAYSIIKNRIARLVLEVGIVSEGLMSRFENVTPRKKTP
ncbi:MAG: MotA/TolQ/ExbB proton channel family protein [Planctomycetes bacterium]|nr:MotA/TolQ/ExbB proton channel family protein [Planctomycetota bacterium]